MKIVFFGTSDFAVAPLKALLEGKHQILGVVTAPDKKSGRGRKLGLSPVKSLACAQGLRVWQPGDLRQTEFIRSLKMATPELFVVCSFGKILTNQVLQIPEKYAINLHASILPKYRGAAPINWAIINDEDETGISIFKMDEYMDRGPIILQKEIKIAGSDTSISLSAKLTQLASAGLREALDLIVRDKVEFREQDESRASLAPKLNKQDGRINWRDSARAIINQVRGLQPWPSAFTYFENKLLKIWLGELIREETQGRPGQIIKISDQGVLIQAGEDLLLVTLLQLAGKRKMPAAEFILGHKIKPGVKLGDYK